MPAEFSLKWAMQRACESLGQLGTVYDRPNDPLYGSRLIPLLNSQYRKLTLQGRNNERHELSTYINDTATDSVLSRRYNPQMGQIIGLQKRASADDTIPGVDEWQRFASSFKKSVGPTDSGPSYNINGVGQIRIEATSTWPHWRIWLLKMPKPLICGTVASWTSLTGVLSLGTSPEYSQPFNKSADAYLGEVLMITDGPAEGSTARVVASSWSGTELLVTLEPADTLTGSVFTTAPTSASKWCLMPWFPPEFMELLAVMAAADVPNYPSKMDVVPSIQSFMVEWEKWVSRRDLATRERLGLNPDMGSLTEGSAGGSFGYGYPWYRSGGVLP